MPARPKRPCSHPSCPELVERGRCDAHQAAHLAAQREETRAYDVRRGSPAARGYDSRWRRYAKRYLRKHPVCACGCRQPSEEVDHITPVNGPDDPHFWDPANHQALSKACHSRKTARENRGFGNAAADRAG